MVWCWGGGINYHINLLLLGWIGGGGKYQLAHKPSMSLFLTCVFAVIDISAKVASLLIIVSWNSDHGFPHGSW